MLKFLPQESLQRYLRACRLACPPDWHVALLEDGRLAADTAQIDLAPLLEAWSCRLHERNHANQQEQQTNPITDYLRVDCTLSEQEVVILSREYTDHLSTTCGHLIFYGPLKDNLLPNTSHLNLMIEMLTNLYQQASELDDMAMELSDRHEELNLVYARNDLIEMHVHDDLLMQTVVENAVDYLGASFTLVSIPAKNVWTWHASEDLDFSQYEAATRLLEPMIIQWLEEHNQPLVINTAEEVAHIDMARYLPFRLLATPIRDSQGKVIGGLALCKDFTQPHLSNSDKNLLGAMAQQINQALRYSYDELTDLATQGKFMRHLETEISHLSGRESHTLIHVGIQDLDYMQDRYGSGKTDKIVRRVARMMRESGRATDLGGRLDDGELLLLLKHCNISEGTRKSQTLLAGLDEQEYFVDGQKFTVKCVIGAAEVHSHHQVTGENEATTLRNRAENLIAQATLANRIAKEQADSRIQIYQPNHDLVLKRRSDALIANQVRTAITNDSLMLFAQPIVPLASKDTAPHFEVLIRLQDDDGEMVSPALFIPVAEQFKIMPELDLWVVEKTLSTLAASTLLEHQPQTVCSINLSGQSFAKDNLVENLTSLIRESSVNPTAICYEVTETATIHDLENAGRVISAIRDLGCRFALDDFGAGMSSFTYLRTLPLDYVKIDGFFVKDMLTNPVAAEMVAAIHQVGAAMGLETVAEYVENAEIAAKLNSLGIDFGQGYSFGKPAPITEVMYACTRESRAYG